MEVSFLNAAVDVCIASLKQRTEVATQQKITHFKNLARFLEAIKSYLDIDFFLYKAIQIKQPKKINTY